MKSLNKIYLPLICLLFLAFLFFKSGLNRSYTEINIQNLLSSVSGVNISQLFSPPASEKESCIPPDQLTSPKPITLTFKKPLILNGFSLFFPGTGGYISYGPSDFDIYYLDQYGNKSLWVSQRNYKESSFKYLSSTKITASSFQIVINKPSLDNRGLPTQTCLQDLKFYQASQKGALDSIFGNLLYGQGMANYWVYYVVFLGLILIPGYALIHFIYKLKTKSLDPEAVLIFAPIVSLVVMVVFGIMRLITGAQWIYPLYWVLFSISLIYFALSRAYQDIGRQKTTLFVWVLALIAIFLPIVRRDTIFNLPYVGVFLDHQVPVPFEGYYGYFIDSRLPWGFGRIYFHRYSLNSPETKSLAPDTPVYDKPPFLPLAVTTLIGLFGEGHFVYQRFLEILVTLYYLSFYLVIKKIFDKRIALIVFLMMLINVPLSQMSINVEVYYKYFAIYPVLLSLILFFDSKKERPVKIGLLLGTAFLIHPLTLIYSAAVLALYFFKYRSPLKVFQKTLPIIVILSLLVGSWFFFPKLSGLNKYYDRDSSFYFGEIGKTSGSLVKNKALILISLLIPNETFKGEKLPVISPLSDEYLYQFFRFSLIANLSPLFFLFLCLVVARKATRGNGQILLLSLLPLLIYWLFYLHRYDRWWGYGSTFFLLFSFVVPLALAYITQRLSLANTIVRNTINFSYVAFMFVSLYYLSGLFSPYKSTIKSADHLTIALFVFYSLLVVLFLKFSLKTRGQE